MFFSGSGTIWMSTYPRKGASGTYVSERFTGTVSGHRLQIARMASLYCRRIIRGPSQAINPVISPLAAIHTISFDTVTWRLTVRSVASAIDSR